MANEDAVVPQSRRWTAGPWKEHGGRTVISASGRVVAQAATVEPADEMTANQRLIVAAPRLYEALLKMAERFALDNTGMSSWREEAAAEAWSALADADGCHTNPASVED
jgi:hypothetical protein